MSLIYVTGAPTSGKTAICGELSARGYEAHDTDDPQHTGIGGWHNLASGKYVGGFNELEVTPEMLATHIWKLTDGTLERFRDRANERQIYLCGTLRDPQAIIEASDYVIWLATNEETIRERFKLPREVDWGNEEWQVEQTIRVNLEREAQYTGLGAITIDSMQPLEVVVDNIIAVTTA